MASQATTPPDPRELAAAPVTRYATDFVGAFPGEDSADAVAGAPISAAVILRSKWLVLGISLALSVVTVPLVFLTVKPTFKATASVHVAPVVSRIIFETEENTRTGNSLYGSFVETQMAIIASPTVLQRVLEKKAVQRTAWYSEPGPLSLTDRLKSWIGRPGPDPLERLTKELIVSRPGRGELIRVSMVAHDARTAALIVNSTVEVYEDYYKNDVARVELWLLSELKEKKAELETKISGLEKRRVSLPSFLGPSEIEELARLESLRGDLEVARDLTAWEVGRLTETNRADAESEDVAPQAPEQRYATDAAWRSLNAASSSAQFELKQAANTLGESHPDVRKLEAALTFADRRLREREQEIDRESELGIADFTGSERPAASAALLRRQEKELELLDVRIKEQRDRAISAADIIDMDGLIARSRRLLERILDRKEAREMEASAPGRVSVQSRATVPSRPDRDRRLLYMIMSICVSVMAGLGAAVVKGNVNPKIFEVGEVQRLVQAPFLGQLPRLPHAPDCTKPLPRLLVEGLRMVRTALLRRLDSSKDRVVLVTSSNGSAGKTTVAIGLANSLAQLGKKTLLVEADLRKPTFRNVLDLKDSPGLEGILTRRNGDATAILKGVAPNLDVLPARDGKLQNGDRGADFDPELLANGLFGSCLKRWKRSYKYIVLDSPPVLPVADARILAAQADGTIMVLRASHCRRAGLVQAYADLSAAGGRLLGSVLVTDQFSRTYASEYASEYAYSGPDPDDDSKQAAQLSG